MNFDKLMPPDPFAQEGVDELELETAERLARDDASGSDPRWVGSLMWRTALAGIAVLVAIGLVLLLVR